MQEYKLALVFKKLEEDSEREVIDTILDEVNAGIFHYIGDGKVKFKVNLFGQKDKDLIMQKKSLDDSTMFLLSINPMEFIDKPSSTGKNRIEKRMTRLGNSIKNKLDCIYTFVYEKEKVKKTKKIKKNKNRKRRW